jgi:hypothetical protein
MLYDPMNDYTPEGRTLLKAARHIEEHGHCKHALSDSEGRVCLIGAVNMAVLEVDSLSDYTKIHGNNDKTDIVSKCLGILSDKLRVDHNAGGTISGWNNKRERTAEEVIDLLKDCAERQKIIA